MLFTFPNGKDTSQHGVTNGTAGDFRKRRIVDVTGPFLPFHYFQNRRHVEYMSSKQVDGSSKD